MKKLLITAVAVSFFLCRFSPAGWKIMAGIALIALVTELVENRGAIFFALEVSGAIVVGLFLGFA